MDEPASHGVPQFATVEYAASPAAEIPRPACAACRKPLGDAFYQVAGKAVCESCAASLRARMPADSHAAFVRAVSFGAGGAVLGFGIYVAFAIGTGLMIGWISLAVGFLVGKAMNVGSGGVGGRRYQIAAIALTYAAVSLSAIPISIHYYRLRHAAADTSPTGAASVAGGTAAAGTSGGGGPGIREGAAAGAVSPPAVATPAHSRPGFAAAAARLALIGLASPFLELSDPAHGIIGLVILFVGLRIAWRMTASKSLNIAGPFRESPRAPGAPI